MLLTVNGPWYEFVPVSLFKLLNAPIDRMAEKNVEWYFQTKLHSIARLFTDNDMMSPKSRKRNFLKILKN